MVTSAIAPMETLQGPDRQMGVFALPTIASMEKVAATPIERDVVIARGDDAQDHLNSQLTQDIASLEVGESAWSFLCDPKSEIIALLRVTRTEPTVFAMDTEVGFGSRILERIDGFLFRMDVSFEAGVWSGVAWRGPGASEIESDAAVQMRAPWPGIDGLDEIGPSAAVPDDAERLAEDELDALRIWLGWPSMADIGEGTTPAMTGIVSHTVSFTKGCYTGQEFIARVHYREAKPPRRLVQVGFHPCAKPTPGTPIVLDGEDVGSLTTVSAYQPVALGYLKRSVDAPGEATCADTPACIGVLPATLAPRETPAPRGDSSPISLSPR